MSAGRGGLAADGRLPRVAKRDNVRARAGLLLHNAVEASHLILELGLERAGDRVSRLEPRELVRDGSNKRELGANGRVVTFRRAGLR